MTSPAWGRVLPVLLNENEKFWTGGAEGLLYIDKCDDCGRFQHPPSPVCRSCRGSNLTPTPVSGRATVATFTVNVQPWFPELDLPYVIAMVELEEDASIRLTTAIVGVDPDEVRIGMPVAVEFHQVDDVWLPLFASVEAS